MAAPEKSGGYGLGILEVLAIVFIVLKLCGVITWSWWWVLCPIWGQFVILALILIFIGIRVLLDKIFYD